MSNRKCYRCGKDPAEGYAAITVGGVDKWYCHGDNDESCYEVESIVRTLAANSENTTREDVEVKVGQRWADLDKRMGKRTGRVVQVRDGKAQLDWGYLKTWVSIRRMHRGSTGYELVKP